MLSKVSKYVWAPLLALATFGAFETWHDIYNVLWDTQMSTVIFTGIMFVSGVLDWWIRWLEYR
jgi:hypothetical protein